MRGQQEVYALPLFPPSRKHWWEKGGNGPCWGPPQPAGPTRPTLRSCDCLTGPNLTLTNGEGNENDSSNPRQVPAQGRLRAGANVQCLSQPELPLPFCRQQQAAQPETPPSLPRGSGPCKLPSLLLSGRGVRPLGNRKWVTAASQAINSHILVTASSLPASAGARRGARRRQSGTLG